MATATDGGVSERDLIWNETNSVLEDWIAELRQFTLFDVTTEVRARLGRDFPIYHYDRDGVEGVHDMALDLLNDKIGDTALGWSRVLIEPPGLKPGADKPQLYYHLSTDPADYGKKNTTVTITNSLPDGNPIPVPALVMATTLVPAPKDKRLCIPKALMEAHSLSPGDKIAVVPDNLNQCLALKKFDPQTDAAYQSYMVDLRGTIRITKSVLDEVGLVGDQFNATNDALGRIVVAQ